MNHNSVTLCGHLTRDAELKYVGQRQTALATFGLTVTRKRGEQESTGFYDCKCWGGTAEAVGLLRKGEAVMVIGELSFEQWDDKLSGAKRSKVVVQADAVGREMYQKKEEAGVAVRPPKVERAPAAVKEEALPKEELPLEDEPVPF